jgi:hypothetical protein
MLSNEQNVHIHTHYCSEVWSKDEFVELGEIGLEVCDIILNHAQKYHSFNDFTGDLLVDGA